MFQSARRGVSNYGRLCLLNGALTSLASREPSSLEIVAVDDRKRGVCVDESGRQRPRRPHRASRDPPPRATDWTFCRGGNCCAKAANDPRPAPCNFVSSKSAVGRAGATTKRARSLVIAVARRPIVTDTGDASAAPPPRRCIVMFMTTSRGFASNYPPLNVRLGPALYDVEEGFRIN